MFKYFSKFLGKNNPFYHLSKYSVQIVLHDNPLSEIIIYKPDKFKNSLKLSNK